MPTDTVYVRTGLRAVLATRAATMVTGWVAAFGLALGLLAAVPAALVLGASPAQADQAEEVILEDGAGVIHEPTLREGLTDIDFREPTTVVVWTQRGEAESNLNERLLADARENHPEWISDDGQKWTDGLFIYAIDPEGRLQGVYFGEDRKVSLDAQEDIREDAVESLTEANWTQAALDATESAAAVMNRPWYQHPGVWIGGAIVVVVGGIFGGAVAAGRKKQRQKAQAELDRGNQAFANVSTDLEATELNAHTVPEGSKYGAMVLERYRTFHERYVEAARQNDRLSGIPSKKLHRKEHRKAITSYMKQAEELDQLDDTVGSTNMLLNKYPGWPEAWDIQTAPMREDLGQIDELVTGQPKLKADQLTPLRSFRHEAERELERLGAGLETGQLSPDEALDGLDALRVRLTGLLDDYAKAQIDAFATSEAERQTLQQELERERHRSSRRPGSILDTVHQPGWFWTATAFHLGYSSGQSHVVTAREQAEASSSSSSTGYGSSGGSFSGAGSSSSF
ncbi:hypothetical protein GCM10010977_06710 [Citricoccus zhacaiensis]|uniref:DUF5129 domain-containing protein n=1 Tax=Citricoccus zhacaiensis TaxID=489142 RepID=A0ABQ2LQN0_9MICC|nr:DUF5129 domain-containing protein [Citricoccus zhacaiensis]GGO41958.1 hypothetical protein GCM10010977_06710 [Citricoccus zhacaiensis]